MKIKLNEIEFLQLENDVTNKMREYHDVCAERDIDFDMAIEDILQEVGDSD